MAAEHTIILQGLAALEGAIARWEGGKPPDPAYLERRSSSCGVFVDQFLDDADRARLARQFEEFERVAMDGGRHEAPLCLLEDLAPTPDGGR